MLLGYHQEMTTTKVRTVPSNFLRPQTAAVIAVVRMWFAWYLALFLAGHLLSPALAAPPQAETPSCAAPPACTKFVSDYRAAGDGRTDDTAALRQAIGSLMPGDVLCFERNGIYVISDGLQIFGGRANNWILQGHGATLKMADHAPSDTSRFILRVRESQGWSLHNLFFDGNRETRFIGPTSRENLSIRGSRDFAVCNVRSVNSVKDGFYVYGTAESDPETFSTNGLFQNCGADNSYRNGMTIVNGRELRIVGGLFSKSNGAMPEAGIDIEPNEDSFEPGVDQVWIHRASFIGNVGYGLQLSSRAKPTRITVDGNYFSDNVRGGIFVGASDSSITNNLLHGFQDPGERGTINLRLFDGTRNTIISGNTLQNIYTGKAVIWVSSGQANGHRIVDNCIASFDGPEAIETPEGNGLFISGNVVNPPQGCPNPLAIGVRDVRSLRNRRGASVTQ